MRNEYIILVFGHSDLKGKQKEVVEAAVDGELTLICCIVPAEGSRCICSIQDGTFLFLHQQEWERYGSPLFRGAYAHMHAESMLPTTSHHGENRSDSRHISIMLYVSKAHLNNTDD